VLIASKKSITQIEVESTLSRPKKIKKHSLQSCFGKKGLVSFHHFFFLRIFTLMSTLISALQPTALWQNFCDLNAVPRASKKEAEVIAFAKAFAEKLGLPVYVDEVGNVIIKKPASKGMEDRTTVVLQSHLDMVHQKNADTVFDFATQGIDMFIDGDWVRAKGTTLGADNGIGVASIMALLQSTDIAHPPLEALFTIDEETGMTGALALKGGLLNGSIMLNLDTEEDNELTIGCAGGIDVSGVGQYDVMPSEHQHSLKLCIKGLTGGHSGIDIHRGRGNANKLMNRLLTELTSKVDIEIHSIDGGSLRNAIPRESVAVICVNAVEDVNTIISAFDAIVKKEYATTDPNINVVCEATHDVGSVLSKQFATKLLATLYAIPHGIYRMSPDIAELVQSSNNLSRVLVQDGTYSIQCLTRSSVDTEKHDVKNAIAACFTLLGAQTQTGGEYPGWAPEPNSTIVKLMSDLYEEMFASKAHVNACHAGLECGILGTNYPAIQMISFGPTIRGAHSPDECVNISSVQKFWSYLLETLKRIPASA
jgi:dipeptidase D